jgi:hypothetical protein
VGVHLRGALLALGEGQVPADQLQHRADHDPRGGEVVLPGVPQLRGAGGLPLTVTQGAADGAQLVGQAGHRLRRV